MLVTLGNSGQFGNAYLSASHFIANALENQYEFRTFGLAPFRHLFVEGGMPSDVRLLGSGKGALRRFCCRVFHRIVLLEDFRIGRLTFVNERKGRFPLTANELATAARTGTVIHLGWLFRDSDALLKRGADVREILRFKTEFVDSAVRHVADLRKGARVVIGVHVRRGDYRHFRSGRFYFGDDVYLRVAQEAAQVLGGNADEVLVLGVSAEKLAWPARIGNCRLATVSGRFWEDLLVLAQCDLIIGPPSTFSGTASFVGNKPYFQITSPDRVFSLSEAAPYPTRGISVGD